MPFPDRIIVRPLEDVNEERKGDDLEMATESGFLKKKGHTKNKLSGATATTAPSYGNQTKRGSARPLALATDDSDEEELKSSLLLNMDAVGKAQMPLLSAKHRASN